MGVFKWLKQTSMRGAETLDAGPMSVEEIVHSVGTNESFAFEIEIPKYADLFQECYERLMKTHGEGAFVLGAWTGSAFNCANCNRAFPDSFKLHLTNPLMFRGLEPRSDCPDCGCQFARVTYQPTGS